jgi:hypothetical protein
VAETRLSEKLDGFFISGRRMQNYDIETLAVRAGTARSQFNEHSEALYLTSSFVFDNAAQAAARFQGSEPGNIYSRFTNPTVTAFQDRLAALEGAEACVGDVRHPRHRDGPAEVRRPHRLVFGRFRGDGAAVQQPALQVRCGD